MGTKLCIFIILAFLASSTAHAEYYLVSPGAPCCGMVTPSDHHRHHYKKHYKKHAKKHYHRVKHYAKRSSVSISVYYVFPGCCNGCCNCGGCGMVFTGRAADYITYDEIVNSMRYRYDRSERYEYYPQYDYLNSGEYMGE